MKLKQKEDEKLQAGIPTDGETVEVTEDKKEEAKDELTEDQKNNLNVLFESEATLSEQFKEKATVIFEAALNAKVKEKVAALEEKYKAELDEQVEVIQEDLVKKIDKYMDYVVSEWMEENKLAVEAGIRTEIAESFIESLKNVFTEHYIEVPESKVDIVEELEEKAAALSEDLNKTIDKYTELKEEHDALLREKIIQECARDMSESQRDKLVGLVEDIEFSDAETFKKKVETIAESFFKETKNKGVDVVTESAEDEDQMVDPVMAQYLEALKLTQK